MRWLLLFAVAALVGCGQSKPDVWSEYATAQTIVQSEWSRLKEIRELLRDDPENKEFLAMQANAEARLEVAQKHASDIRKRIPGMPSTPDLSFR